MPSFSLEVVLIQHAVISILNMVLMGMLWVLNRSSLYGYLGIIWVATLVAIIAQGVSLSSPFWMMMSFSLVVFISLGISLFLRDLYGVSVWGKTYGVLYSLSVGSSILLTGINAPFWISALPISLGVSLPLACSLYQSWVRMRARHALDQVLILSFVGFLAGYLGFPYLRLDPLWGPLGYHMALIVLIAVSIVAPAVVMRRQERDRLSWQVRSESYQRVTQFLSHEVKNALYAIGGNASLIKKGTLSAPETVEALTHIGDTSDRLERLTKQYLSLEKIGIQAPPKVPCSCEEVIVECGRLVTIPSGVDLQIRGDITAPIAVHKEELEALVVNLLQNALRYARTKVTLSLKKKDSALVLTVQDDGPGMEAAVLSTVQALANGEAANSHKGFGLRICQRIIQGYGADWDVLSDASGTCMTLYFRS